MAERRFWDKYQEAFSDMLSNTSTGVAPWHVIPADRKWFMRLAAMGVLLETMKAINPQYPVVSPEGERAIDEMRRALENGE